MPNDAGGQRPIQGYRQYESTQKDVEEPIDKDEFQKKIKEIESSTEAPHKKKREQADDDGAGLEGLNQPQHVFDAKKDIEPSPFEVQSPQSSRRQTYQGQKGADMEFIEEGTPPTTTPEEERTPFAPPPSPEKQAAPQPQPTTPPPSNQPTTSQPAPEKSQTEQPQKQTSQTQDSSTQSPQSQTQKGASLPTSPLKTSPAEKKEASPTAPLKEPQKIGKKGAKKAADETEETPVTHEPASEIAKIEKEKSQKAKEQQGAGVEGVTTSDQPTGTGNVIAPTAAMGSSPLNPLSPIYELFNNMVSHITIENAKSGLQTTTVQISLKNSAFDGAKLKLERFPTARDTFNVQLSSDNPKAVDLFNENMPQLTAAFQAGRYPFKVNINRAVHAGETAKEKAKRVNRKGDVG